MARSTRNTLVIVLLVVAGLVVSWVAADRRSAPGNASVAAPAPAPASLPPPTSDQTASRPVAQSSGARTIEICGVGLVETDDTNTMPPRVLKTLDDTAMLKRAAAELGASGNPSDRAVALLFEARLAEQAAFAGSTPDRHACDINDVGCMTALSEAGRLAAQGYVQSLAQLAAQSADPVAFTLAYFSCGAGPRRQRVPGCEAITVERWTAIDPDNGIAWLVAAGVAAGARDEAARVAALERAAAAPRFDQYETALLRPVASPVLARATPLERFTVNLGASLTMFSVSAYSVRYAARDYCLPTAGVPATAERQALCGRLATALIERDTSFIGHGIGAHLGEAAGWPAERLTRHKREHEALFMMWRDANPDIDGALSCAAIDAQTRRYADTLHLGERAALRRQMERAGKSVAQLSDEYRARYGEVERRRAAQAR